MQTSNRLFDDLARVASGAFRKKLEDLGTTPLDESPAYFKHFLSEDIARWRDVIHAAHIHQQ